MNQRIIEVDQDSIDASRISYSRTAQVFGKMEKSGDGVVGLFDTNTHLAAASETITTTTHAIGLPSDPFGYIVENLWTGQTWKITSGGMISASVSPEGVALYRVTPVPW